MTIGDVDAVPGSEGVTYVDTGMYDVPEYGAVYLLDAERPALVDAGIGTDHERVLSLLDEADVAREELAYVLPTHVHLDHAGGAGMLAEACPNATVLTHERGVRHLVDPERLVAGTKQAVGQQWRHYVEPTPVPEARIDGLADGDVVDLGDRVLHVHEVPGHAPHQVAFHEPDDGLCFVADAAGVRVPEHEAVRQTSPPPNFDLETCLDDVATLQALDPDVLCYPHFGPWPYERRVLAEYADVLTSWVADIEAAREELADDEAVVDHFVAEDEMADTWGAEKAREEAKMNVRGVLHYLDGER